MKPLALAFLITAPQFAAETVLVISPHGGDFVRHAGATLARMAAAGDTIHLVRVTNDEKHSATLSVGETRLRTREETEAAAKILGIRNVIHLNFKDAELDGVAETELRARLILLIRKIRPTAIFTSDPWTRYDDQFDHQKTARTAEDACWTAGNDKFHPEINFAGLEPYSVPRRYYWSSGIHLANHDVDTGEFAAARARAFAAMPVHTSFTQERARPAKTGVESFHRTAGSGLAAPYAAWYESQKASGKAWGAPEAPAKIWKPGLDSPKVLAVVSPHADDFSFFGAGTIAQLAKQGTAVYLIRVTNDEKDSYDLSYADTIRTNAEQVEVAAKHVGIREVISLNFKNDELDPVSQNEIRGRLILLFRKLKPDALMTYDPWSLYEENPDHVKIARASAEAAWASGLAGFNPEHFALGLQPHTVTERWYWTRGPSNINRAVDVSSVMDRKIAAVLAHKTMMRATALHLKDKLTVAGLRLPLLDKEDEASINELLTIQVREGAAATGALHGLRYAEQFVWDNGR